MSPTADLPLHHLCLTDGFGTTHHPHLVTSHDKCCTRMQEFVPLRCCCPNPSFRHLQNPQGCWTIEFIQSKGSNISHTPPSPTICNTLNHFLLSIRFFEPLPLPFWLFSTSRRPPILLPLQMPSPGWKAGLLPWSWGSKKIQMSGNTQSPPLGLAALGCQK